MSNKQILKGMISERLSEAADEIFALFEQALVEYQREIDRLKTASECQQIQIVLTPLETETVGQEVRTDTVVNDANEGSCKEETEPSMIPTKDEPHEIILNGQVLNGGDELQPRGEQQQKANCADPEQNQANATEGNNGPEADSDSEQKDSDMDNDEEASGSDAPNKGSDCPACKRSFPHIKHLKIHMRKTHPEEKALYLAVCKSQLGNERPLIPVMGGLREIFNYTVCLRQSSPKREQTEGNSYLCSQCGESFPSKSSFTKHMDKPFKCSVCDIRSRSVSALKIHMQIHTGEKPFVCSVCGKGFAVKAKLTYHSSKCFKCKKCDENHTSKQSRLCHVCAEVGSPLKHHTKTVSQKELSGTSLNKENTGSSEDNGMKMETEQTVTTQEVEPQAQIINAESLNIGDELQPQEQQEQKSNKDPEEQLSEGTERDNSAEPNSECENENADAGSDYEPIDFDKPKSLFSCSVCTKRFRQSKGLKMHMRVHTKKKLLATAESTEQLDSKQRSNSKPQKKSSKKALLSCTVCDRRFKQRDCLKLHMKKHTGNDPYKCTKCNVPFTKQSHFIRHMKTVHSMEKPFECSECSRCCRTAQALREHMLIHTGERPFLCSVCGKGFISSSNLKAHMCTHTGERPYDCTKCGERHFSRRTLLLHKCRVVTPTHSEAASLNEENTGSTSDKAAIKQTINASVNGEKELQPNEQQKNENQEDGDRDNSGQRTSKPEKEVSHTGCQKEQIGFKSQTKQFHCSVCKKGFSLERNLDVHIKKMHADIDSSRKLFSCTICDARFTISHSLKVHMKKHTKSDPFQCSDCSVTFARQAHFLRHMKKVHSVERPFECSVCGKRSKTVGVHNEHRMIHTGERPFRCSVCGKGFVISANLKAHMRTHTGERPYTCAECGKKYSSNTSLKLHLRLYHS